MTIRVTNVVIRDGKLKRIHKLSASKRKGAHAKAARTEAGLRKNRSKAK